MSGFTIIELMLALGILVLLVAISVPLALNFYNSRSLDVYEQGIVQALRRAQLKAMSQERDSAFGVYIDSDKYVLFKGSSYIARDSDFDQIIELPAALQVSGLSEIVFSKITGIPLSFGTTTLTADIKTETININEVGRINY